MTSLPPKWIHRRLTVRSLSSHGAFTPDAKLRFSHDEITHKVKMRICAGGVNDGLGATGKNANSQVQNIQLQ